VEARGAARDLPSLAIQAHGLIFAGVYPFAGRHRGSGEAVHVGHAEHEFHGKPADHIDDCLCKLNQHAGPIDTWPKEQKAFAIRAARFLRRFFEIHPFADGNGRTARLMVECAAALTGTLRIVPLQHGKPRHASRDQREYLCALQEAHKRVGLTRAQYQFEASGSVADGCARLARWWAKRIALLDLSGETPPEQDED